MRTDQTVSQYLEALPANRYDVRLVHAETSKPVFKRSWSANELLANLPFLKFKNREGYNVYCRPFGYEFVLVDDVRRPMLETAASLKPAALIETSPNNYQVWFILSSIPQSREQAKGICQYLSELLEGDPASAEPDHIGRLCGFTNRKPKYEKNGLFPFVKLHRYQYRFCLLDPNDFPADRRFDAHSNTPKSNQHRKGTTHDNSRSGQDFNLACMLIRKGFDDGYIYQRLAEKSEKAKEQRHAEKYLTLTIQNAHKAVEC
jgi:hypothetical protein